MLQLNRHTWGYTKTGTHTNSRILSAEGIHILVFAKMLTGMKNLVRHESKSSTKCKAAEKIQLLGDVVLHTMLANSVVSILWSQFFKACLV